MEDKRNIITSRQFMVFVISSQVGISLFSVPYSLSRSVGHDAWMPVLLSGIVSILLSTLIIKLMERYGNKSIFDINICLYGKYVGSFINIFIALYLSMKGLIALRYLGEIIHIIVLKATPPLVITTFLMVPTVYLTWYGLKALCRYSALIFISMLAVILLYVVNLGHIRLEFLMPIGVCSIPSIFNAMLVTAYSFLAFVNVTVLYPFIDDKYKLQKHVYAAIAASTIFIMISVIFITAFFGENMVKHLIFPILALAESYKAPVLERIELFFLIVWLPALSMTIRMYFFTSYHSINKLFNIRKKTISLILLTISMILLSRIPRDFNQIYSYLQFSEMIGVPLDFGLAVLNYGLSFIFKKGVVK